MKEYKTMTIEGIKEINRLYDSGKSCTQIVAITGYSRSTVYNYIYAPKRSWPEAYKPRVTTAGAADMNRLYEKGMSIKDISKRTGYSEETVRRHVTNKNKRGRRHGEAVTG